MTPIGAPATGLLALVTRLHAYLGPDVVLVHLEYTSLDVRLVQPVRYFLEVPTVSLAEVLQFTSAEHVYPSLRQVTMHRQQPVEAFPGFLALRCLSLIGG